jgi:serine/threonine protein kinase
LRASFDSGVVAKTIMDDQFYIVKAVNTSKFADNEIRVLNTLKGDHHTVQLLGTGTTDGHTVMVFPFIDESRVKGYDCLFKYIKQTLEAFVQLHFL